MLVNVHRDLKVDVVVDVDVDGKDDDDINGDWKSLFKLLKQ